MRVLNIAVLNEALLREAVPLAISYDVFVHMMVYFCCPQTTPNDLGRKDRT